MKSLKIILFITAFIFLIQSESHSKILHGDYDYYSMHALQNYKITCEAFKKRSTFSDSLPPDSLNSIDKKQHYLIDASTNEIIDTFNALFLSCFACDTNAIVFADYKDSVIYFKTMVFSPKIIYDTIFTLTQQEFEDSLHYRFEKIYCSLRDSIIAFSRFNWEESLNYMTIYLKNYDPDVDGDDLDKYSERVDSIAKEQLGDKNQYESLLYYLYVYKIQEENKLEPMYTLDKVQKTNLQNDFSKFIIIRDSVKSNGDTLGGFISIYNFENDSLFSLTELGDSVKHLYRHPSCSSVFVLRQDEGVNSIWIYTKTNGLRKMTDNIFPHSVTHFNISNDTLYCSVIDINNEVTYNLEIKCSYLLMGDQFDSFKEIQIPNNSMWSFYWKYRKGHKIFKNFFGNGNYAKLEERKPYEASPLNEIHSIIKFENLENNEYIVVDSSPLIALNGIIRDEDALAYIYPDDKFPTSIYRYHPEKNNKMQPLFTLENEDEDLHSLFSTATNFEIIQKDSLILLDMQNHLTHLGKISSNNTINILKSVQFYDYPTFSSDYSKIFLMKSEDYMDSRIYEIWSYDINRDSIEFLVADSNGFMYPKTITGDSSVYYMKTDIDERITNVWKYNSLIGEKQVTHFEYPLDVISFYLTSKNILCIISDKEKTGQSNWKVFKTVPRN